ncbi:MAG TPA: hypothetical protein ENJ35_09530, partial [Gammaproteobacteria bacterium]|nr:hypothetical protein [Gammaproteobacteria bacterium]
MKGRNYGWGGSRLITLILTSVLITGCAGLQKKPDGPSSRDELRSSNHGQALAKLGTELDEEGKDRFLYLAGAGLIKNLHGDYEESNNNLEEASRLAEDLQTKRAS